jgi:hypothetical protein
MTGHLPRLVYFTSKKIFSTDKYTAKRQNSFFVQFADSSSLIEERKELDGK